MKINNFFATHQAKDNSGLTYTTFYATTISDRGDVRIGNDTFTAYLPNGCGDGEVRIRFYNISLENYYSNFCGNIKWERSGTFKGQFSVYVYDCDGSEELCRIDTEGELVAIYYCKTTNKPIVAFVSLI